MGSIREQPLILELPTDSLLKVFSNLSLEERRSLRYVCKSWAKQLKSSGVLYEELKVDLTGMDRYLPSSVTGLKEVVFQEFSQWANPRAPFARHLDLTLSPSAEVVDFCTQAVARIVDKCTSTQRLERLELQTPGRLWLPASLSKLAHLRVLALAANSTISPLPNWLGHLEALEELHINMEIAGGYRVAETFLPLQLLSLVRLRQLSLEGCHNLHIPLCVGELYSLQRLVIRDCGKLLLHEGVFMQNTFATLSMRSLTLANCNLHAVPYQVVGLGNLRELDLSENHLTVLPATFSVGLKSLKRLILRENRFRRLPRLLARLPGLEYLELSFNNELQVHESEEEETEDAGQRASWQGGRQRVHTMTSLLGLLPHLEHLDLRQRPGKRWHRASLLELQRLREMVETPSGSLMIPACSLKRLLL